MTGREYETQKIVADLVVESSIKIGYSHLLPLNVATNFLVLAFQQLISAEVINGPMFRGCHQPGARVIRDT